jgi:hypothetical protein
MPWRLIQGCERSKLPHLVDSRLIDGAVRLSAALHRPGKYLISLCLIKLSTTPRRRMEEWNYNSTILDLGTRWRWVVSFKPRPLYPWKNDPDTNCIEDWPGGSQNRSGRCREVSSPFLESNRSVQRDFLRNQTNDRLVIVIRQRRRTMLEMFNLYWNTEFTHAFSRTQMATYTSTLWALQSMMNLGLCFTVSQSYTQSLGLPGWGIRPLLGRYLHRTTQALNKCQYACLEWDSNLRPHRLSGRKQFMP